MKHGRIGVTGYCMGAGIALRIAGDEPKIAAAAGFHGGRLATDAPDSPHLLAPKIKAKVYVGGADGDAGFPPEQADRLREALSAAGVDNEITIYEGAKHGYTMRDLPVYSEPAAERHWTALFKLLDETLKQKAGVNPNRAHPGESRDLGRGSIKPRRTQRDASLRISAGSAVDFLQSPGTGFRRDERVSCGRVLSRRRFGRGLLGLDLLLDLQGARRELLVLGLDQEGVQAAAEVHRAQGRVGDAQVEALAQRVGRSFTGGSAGRKRRLDLMLEWLTLWPIIGPTPVSSQRRDMGSAFAIKTAPREASGLAREAGI